VFNEERAMRARWPVLVTCVALGAGYLGYPYATLYRLDTAVRQSDAVTLRSLVDWYAVREGLKEDICDMVLDAPANARPSNELAPFGSGFVHGMTGNALDRTVTPETFVSMIHAGAAAAPVGVPVNARVEWAFFENPTQFSVQLRAASLAQPIRLVMELRGLSWKVRRVWLPNALLERAGSAPDTAGTRGASRG
jgi:Protein of unknown function (DUF2939)